MLPHRLGLLDCRFVIPAAAARSFAHGRGSKIGSGLAFLVATLAESRAPPGRELVDLCGPVIRTRIHYRLSFVEAHEHMLRLLVLHWLLNRYRPRSPLVQPD